MIAAFKIEYFRRDHPDQEFPWFRQLSSDDSQRLLHAFSTRLGLPDHTDARAVLSKLFENAVPIEDGDANQDGFDIQSLMYVHGFMPGELLYVDWGRFDRIYQMKRDDVAQYFDDLWYPSSDDLSIFDDTCSWIIFIDHHGSVSIGRYGVT
jgi:hypothetical protein